MKVYPKDNNREVTTVFMREEQSGLEATREALLKEGVVKVINEYETFYGVSFDGWLREGVFSRQLVEDFKNYMKGG